MLELTGVLPEILKLGTAGLFIAYLIWTGSERTKEIAKLRDDVRDSQEARLTDLKTITTEMRIALTQSTEVMRANNVIQDKAGNSAAAIATAVAAFQDAIERVEARVNDLASRTGRAPV